MTDITESVRLLQPKDAQDETIKNAHPRVAAGACQQFYTLQTIFMLTQSFIAWILHDYVRPYLTANVERNLLRATLVLWVVVVILSYSSLQRRIPLKDMVPRAIFVNLLLAALVYFACYLISYLLLQVAILSFAALMAVSALFCWVHKKLHWPINMLLLAIVNVLVEAAAIAVYLHVQHRPWSSLRLFHVKHADFERMLLVACVTLLVLFTHWRFRAEVRGNSLSVEEVPPFACAVLVIVVMAAVVQVYTIAYLIVFRSKSKMLAGFLLVAALALEYKLDFW